MLPPHNLISSICFHALPVCRLRRNAISRRDGSANIITAYITTQGIPSPFTHKHKIRREDIVGTLTQSAEGRRFGRNDGGEYLHRQPMNEVVRLSPVVRRLHYARRRFIGEFWCPARIGVVDGLVAGVAGASSAFRALRRAASRLGCTRFFG